MSRAGRKTKRFKPAPDVRRGPSIADYYRYRFSLPGGADNPPTYVDYQRWAAAAQRIET